MSGPLWDETAERALLGVLLAGSSAVHDVEDVLTGADFYQPRHEAVYDAILAVTRAGNRADPVVVNRELGTEAQRLGGAPFLLDLLAQAATGHQAVHYAQAIADKAMARRLVEVSQRIADQAGGGGDVLAVAEDARAAIESATSTARTQAHGSMAGDLLADTLDALEGDRVPGLSTGWPDLDDTVYGMLPGQQIVVGARPSVGKSVIGTNLAATVAASGVPVYLWSLEMTKREVMNRILSAAASVDLGHLMHHRLDDGDWQNIGNRASVITGWPLIVDEEPGTVQQLRTRARSAKRRMGGLGMIVVDYLQLVTPHDTRAPREQQVSAASRACKLLAKELQCVVVLLAQLNRNTSGGERPPRMSDLRESGAIEQDADLVWLLHRPDMEDPESPRMGEMDVIVDKNRNGTRRPVTLVFQGHYSRAVSGQA